MDALRPILPYLIPIILLEIGLMVFALRDLSRRERVKGPKWAWALVIILIQLIGPIVYFTAGRSDE
jgi:hypothetical protein